MSNTVKTIATLTARSGKAEGLQALLAGMVTPSRAEPGNLHYQLWQDRANSASFVLDELYVDDAAVAAHRASPHFQSYAARINGLADRTVLLLQPVAAQ